MIYEGSEAGADLRGGGNKWDISLPPLFLKLIQEKGKKRNLNSKIRNL